MMPKSIMKFIIDTYYEHASLSKEYNIDQPRSKSAQSSLCLSCFQ